MCTLMIVDVEICTVFFFIECVLYLTCRILLRSKRIQYAVTVTTDFLFDSTIYFEGFICAIEAKIN